MRPFRVTLTAAGYTPWIPVVYNQSNFNITLAVIPASGVTGTFTVQMTPDNPLADGTHQVQSLVQTASTTVTVTDLGSDGNGHRLSTGDGIVISGSGPQAAALALPQKLTADLDGSWTVASVTSATVYTFTAAVSQTYTSLTAQAANLRIFPVTGLSAVTTRTLGNISQSPICAVRLYASALSGGIVDLVGIQGLGT